MRAKPVGPPERWMRNHEIQRGQIRAGLELDHLSSNHCLVRQIIDENCSVHIGRGDNLNFRGKARRASVNLFLNDVEIVHTYCVPRLERHGLPNSAGHEARTPVPSILIGRLADIRFGLDLRLRLPARDVFQSLARRTVERLGQDV